MNFYKNIVDAEPQKIKSFIQSYIGSMNPDELKSFIGAYVPQKINHELTSGSTGQDYTTKPPLSNLMNICGIPICIMFIITFVKCIPLVVKVLVIILVIIHIIVSTCFIINTERHKVKQTQILPSQIDNPSSTSQYTPPIYNSIKN